MLQGATQRRRERARERDGCVKINEGKEETHQEKCNMKEKKLYNQQGSYGQYSSYSNRERERKREMVAAEEQDVDINDKEEGEGEESCFMGNTLAILYTKIYNQQHIINSN
jgi:hypothetical protein